MQDIISTPPSSYWIASTQQTNYPKFTDNIKVDVAIVGGGIVGILCAYFLSNQGVKTAVFDADKILKGTTGHTTAKITSQHELRLQKIQQISNNYAQQYAAANETAIRMFENIIKQHNIDCNFIWDSAYVYTRQDSYIEQIQKEAHLASTLGITASYLQSTPLPLDIKAAVRYDNQAKFHPRKFLLPLADIITKSGSQIFEQTRIVDLEHENNTYYLKTIDNLQITADKVIIASHYPFFNKAALYFSRIYPERSYIVAIKAKENYPGGMYITAETPPGRSIRSQQTENGEIILVAGEHHKTGQGEDTINHYKNLVLFAKEHFTVTDMPFHWSAQDCMSVDDIPLVGHYTDDTENLFVATGFGKWGMSNGMASAMLLSDLILGKPNQWQDVYSPSRHDIMASAKTFVVENANVAKELIKGKIESVPNNIEIKNGDGKVIEINGQRAGAYRDEQGKLHIVNTTCTHMGCELNWNSAEKTWDCPCHGSRFGIDGDIIEGPAVRHLDLDEHTDTLEKLFKDEY
ncbi:MAG: FAD-dependent oxidoreductase [Eubacteriaceae bacterium]|nr:FAD-dependent oxidoreductase [Eubacteriaceae bacterium]